MDWLRLHVLAGLGHKLLLERYLRHEVFIFQYFSLVFPTLKNERCKRKLENNLRVQISRNLVDKKLHLRATRVKPFFLLTNPYHLRKIKLATPTF